VTIQGLMAILLLVYAAFDTVEAGDTPDQVMEAWLKRQASLRSWSADVLQTRTLKSLARPLQTPGQVWFMQPNRFRWQLGDPPRTIAIRTQEELAVIYPRLKQVERYPSSDDLDSSWRQVLALLEVGFPSDTESFRARYDLISGIRSGEIWRFKLRPSDMEAQRLLEQILIEVSAEDFTLLATELIFPDGSTMRNQFSGHRFNPSLDEMQFELQIEEGYRVVYPLRARN
jgi:outer membrane lipoprotein-sorting protein